MTAHSLYSAADPEALVNAVFAGPADELVPCCEPATRGQCQGSPTGQAGNQGPGAQSKSTGQATFFPDINFLIKQGSIYNEPNSILY